MLSRPGALPDFNFMMAALSSSTVKSDNRLQGSKFHLSVSPGQVDFPPDNKITNICCPSDNLDRGSVACQMLLSDLRYSDLVRHDHF